VIDDPTLGLRVYRLCERSRRTLRLSVVVPFAERAWVDSGIAPDGLGGRVVLCSCTYRIETRSAALSEEMAARGPNLGIRLRRDPALAHRGPWVEAAPEQLLAGAQEFPEGAPIRFASGLFRFPAVAGAVEIVSGVDARLCAGDVRVELLLKLAHDDDWPVHQGVLDHITAYPDRDDLPEPPKLSELHLPPLPASGRSAPS
jgi:hypothetical protein